MRLPSPALAALLSAGCAYLEEQRAASDQATWSGDVLIGPYAEDATLLTDGSVTFSYLDGHAEDVEATQYDSSPGAWWATLDVDQELSIRLSGPDVLTTVWRDRSPTGRAYWFDGGLFARTAAELDATVAALIEAGLLAEAPASLADGEVAALWGAPADPEAWAGAVVTVLDGATLPAQVLLVQVTEDGAYAASDGGRVDAFFAFDLAPGDVKLTVTGAEGGTAQTIYPAQAGDLLHPAFYFLAGG